MEQVAQVVVAIVVIGIVMFVGAYFSESARTLRAMRDAPRVAISEAPEGKIVRLVGRIVPFDRTLSAPLTHRTCVAFRVQVETYHRGKRRGRWRTTIDQRDATEFALEDGTGRGIVRALGAKLLVDLDHATHSGTGNDATPELEAFLSAHGESSTGLLGFNKSMRYREGVLEAGETVAVVGLARWEDDPDGGAIDPDRGGFRDAPRKKRLVLEPGPGGAIYASDVADTKA